MLAGMLLHVVPPALQIDAAFHPLPVGGLLAQDVEDLPFFFVYVCHRAAVDGPCLAGLPAAPGKEDGLVQRDPETLGAGFQAGDIGCQLPQERGVVKDPFCHNHSSWALIRAGYR